MGSLETLTAMLLAEVNVAESDDSEMHILSVEPVMLTDLETGRHVPEMLMAHISNSEPRLFSMSDATDWDMPGNEREYNRFPQKQVLYELKMKKVELYKSLNTSSLVRCQPEGQVLDGMWVYGKKYNAAASPSCQPTVRYRMSLRAGRWTLMSTTRMLTWYASLLSRRSLLSRPLTVFIFVSSISLRHSSPRWSSQGACQYMRGKCMGSRRCLRARLQGRPGGIMCSSYMFPFRALFTVRLAWGSTYSKFSRRKPTCIWSCGTVRLFGCIMDLRQLLWTR